MDLVHREQIFRMNILKSLKATSIYVIRAERYAKTIYFICF